MVSHFKVEEMEAERQWATFLRTVNEDGEWRQGHGFLTPHWVFLCLHRLEWSWGLPGGGASDGPEAPAQPASLPERAVVSGEAYGVGFNSGRGLSQHTACPAGPRI